MAEVRQAAQIKTGVELDEIETGEFFQWGTGISERSAVYVKGFAYSIRLRDGVTVENVNFIGKHAIPRKGYIQLED